MVRQCDRRICLTDSLTISQTIPNRLNYFDDQGFALHPICVEMTPLTTNETTKKHLTAYPIPTKDLLTLEVEPSHSGASYSIYNQIGKRVMEGTIEYTKAVIDISRLSDGVYILNIGHGMNQHVKIIKQ